MSTIETRPFLPYSYIFWRVVYRNIMFMCIILVANIIWRSGHAIRSSFLVDFSFLHHNCEVSSQFSTSQLNDLQHSYMIILAVRLMGTPFGRQIVLSIHKKWSKIEPNALSDRNFSFKQTSITFDNLVSATRELISAFYIR